MRVGERVRVLIEDHSLSDIIEDKLQTVWGSIFMKFFPVSDYFISKLLSTVRELSSNTSTTECVHGRHKLISKKELKPPPLVSRGA